MRRVFLWLGRKHEGIPHGVLILATSLALFVALLLCGALVLAVRDRILASSVVNDSQFIAQCRGHGGLLGWHVVIDPGQRKKMGVGTCIVVERSARYVGCLTIADLHSTYRVSAADRLISVEDCLKPWGPESFE
jgi:hypothetical protein